jgi:hypothetical protein
MGGGELAAIEARAAGDAAAVVAERAARRRGFDERRGFRVVIEAAPGKPLWPQGFDPLNVERVEGGVLHTRFLRLGNDAGTVEAVDGDADLEALTEAAGAHPLFNGVSRVTFLLPAAPEVAGTRDRVVLRGPGYAAEFGGAAVDRTTTTLVVRLGR